MTTSKPKPMLGYWDIRGAGQPIRYLLKYLNIDYVERQYPSTSSPVSHEWQTDKRNLDLDFPNLPYWIDGDIRLSESRAIMKHLIRTHDPTLFPEGDAAKRRADMLDGVLRDIWSNLVAVCYINTPTTIQTYATVVPQKLDLVAKFIGNNRWCLGSKISYLDFLIYEILYQSVAYSPTILDKYSNLKKLMNRFKQIPEIANFMESPEYIKNPCLKRCATVKI